MSAGHVVDCLLGFVHCVFDCCDRYFCVVLCVVLFVLHGGCCVLLCVKLVGDNVFDMCCVLWLLC